MSRAQSILIFLPDGSPRSVRIAEITNRSVKAVLFPRNKLEYLGQREEVKNVGIYFLFGESSEDAKPLVYIGEAEDCYTRLKQHNRNKDFWQYGLVIVSKSQAFTKGHIKYLEYLSIKFATEVNRYNSENGQVPNKPFVTEPMEADLMDNFDSIKILLATLGFPIFEAVNKQAVVKLESEILLI
ncbi:MAG: GIY-YIG nuclease family protein, partial [Bacteroidota bacterium]